MPWRCSVAATCSSVTVGAGSMPCGITRTLVAAVNQAQSKARELYEAEMRKAAGGLPFPLPGM